MGKPSKLKIAIKEVADRIEGHRIDVRSLENLIVSDTATLEMMRKIEKGEK